MDIVCRECRSSMVTFAEDVCKSCRDAIRQERERRAGMCTQCHARRPFSGPVCLTCKLDDTMAGKPTKPRKTWWQW